MRPSTVPQPGDSGAKARLLTAAIALFDVKGYAATTVREIVNSAGVTQPVLYYYFGNKEGIFLELMGDAFERFERVMGETREISGSAVDRIRHLCDRTLALIFDNIAIVRVMNSIYYGPPQGAPRFDFDRFHRVFQDQVIKLVEDGMAAGELRRGNVADVMWAIIGVFNIVMEIELAHPDQSLGRAGLQRLLDLVLHGLAADGGPDGESAS
jgi:AcrR family transcriptional regulator